MSSPIIERDIPTSTYSPRNTSSEITSEKSYKVQFDAEQADVAYGILLECSSQFSVLRGEIYIVSGLQIEALQNAGIMLKMVSE